ncbi:Hypothetical_protein [Hexamita inflata]|uniref:Hypothetical_protein n=1 Tax=Hexamita inflata TaxID=28002 RepID=A0AA86QIU7_9EUKA|nr:Hypothetical protein HINF_LOCUS44606 [Hexamita inflata]
MGQEPSFVPLEPVYTSERDSLQSSEFAPYTVELYESIMDYFDNTYNFASLTSSSAIQLQVELIVDSLARATNIRTVLNNLPIKQLLQIRTRFYQKYILNAPYRSLSSDSLICCLVQALNAGQPFKDVVKQLNITEEQLKFVV